MTFEGCDVLIAPAAPIAAFPHDRRPFCARTLTLSDGTRAPYLAMLHWQALASVLGLPATTMPLGLTADRLPVGAQIIGPEGSNSKTLAVAEAVAEVASGFAAPPLDRLIREAERPPEPPPPRSSVKACQAEAARPSSAHPGEGRDPDPTVVRRSASEMARSGFFAPATGSRPSPG